MNKEKFTPGPWSLDLSHIQSNVTVIYGGKDGYAITLMMTSTGISKEEQLFNANLIAAAPELYEALKAIISDTEIAHLLNEDKVQFGGNLIDLACQALAKARGDL